MKGREKCKILKQLRKKIADENGIAYEVENCKYKGDCTGTCPKCEADLKKLTSDIIEKRLRQGLTGLGVGSIALSLAGCTEVDLHKYPVIPDTTESVLMGDIDVSIMETEDLEEDSGELSGNVSIIEEEESTDSLTDEPILLGDVVDVGEIEDDCIYDTSDSSEAEESKDNDEGRFMLDKFNFTDVEGGMTYETLSPLEDEVQE